MSYDEDGHRHEYVVDLIIDRCHYSDYIGRCECGQTEARQIERDFAEFGEQMFFRGDCERCVEKMREAIA